MTNELSSGIGAQLYASYDGWKGWVEPFQFDQEQAAYFAAELRGRPLHGKKLLEIGFGNGEFLAWARSQGADVVGSEITPAAIAAAQSHQIALISPDFERVPSAHAAQFDIIAAFDVFEHLDPATIIAKLNAVDTMLAPDGWLLLRFPNGQSPLGLGPQHGDATHVTALSRAKIEQYASGTSLRTLHYAGAARSPSGKFGKNLVRRLRYFLRDRHKAMLNFLYATDIELEPVVTLIMTNDAKLALRVDQRSDAHLNKGQ